MRNKDQVTLLKNEEKLALLRAVNLMLTNKRVVYHNEFYASAYLNDITLIKRQYHENTTPLIVAAFTIVLGLFFWMLHSMIFVAGIAAIIVFFCFVSYFSSRYNSLNIHCPGSSGIEVRLKGVSKEMVKDFTHKIETQMDIVKNNANQAG